MKADQQVAAHTSGIDTPLNKADVSLPLVKCAYKTSALLQNKPKQ